MKLTETFELHAPPESAYAFLSDVPRVADCVPGVEDVEQRDDGSYEAALKIQLGPIKAAFVGEVALEEHPPDRLVADGKGRDRSSGSRAQVAFEARLTPLGGGERTQVETVADITIRGRLGQFGTGVIRATATEVIRDFVACADTELARVLTEDPASEGRAPGAATAGTDPARDATAPAGGGHTSTRPSRSGGTSQLWLFLRIVRNLLRSWWTALRARIGRTKGR